MGKRNQNKDISVSRQYDCSRMYELRDAYGRWSYAKQKAWEHCKDLCYEYHGRGLKILGANSSFFSAGFLFTDEETGAEKVMKITASGHEAYDYL